MACGYRPLAKVLFPRCLLAPPPVGIQMVHLDLDLAAPGIAPPDLPLIKSGWSVGNTPVFVLRRLVSVICSSARSFQCQFHGRYVLLLSRAESGYVPGPVG